MSNIRQLLLNYRCKLIKQINETEEGGEKEFIKNEYDRVGRALEKEGIDEEL